MITPLPDTTTAKAKNHPAPATQSDTVGNTITLDSKDFNQGFIVSPEELILGKVAGLRITSNSGKPGDGFTIQNRGISTFLTDNSPLYIVDNVPIVNGYININPNDIATVTVMKDAWAVALYGDRAAHGAIVITTKKGDGTAKVSYIGKVGISFLPKQVDVFSSDEFRKLVSDRFSSSPTILSLLGNASTNWQSEIYRTAINQDHHIDFSDSIKIIPYRIAFGSTDLKGIIKTSGNKRNSVSVALTPSFFDNHMKVNITLNGLFTEESLVDENIVQSAVYANPTQPVKNSDGYYYYPTGNSSAIDGTPVVMLNTLNNKLNSDRYIGNVLIDYKLHFFEALRVILNYGEDYLKTNNHELSILSLNNKRANQKVKSKNLDLSANYFKNIESLSSNINVAIGVTQNDYSISDTSIQYIYSPDILFTSSSFESRSRSRTIYIRIGYSFKNRYCLNFSNRQQTTNIADNNAKRKISYATTLKWVVKNEMFLKNSRTISTLNLRAEYGVSGANSKLNNSFNDFFETYSSPENITAKSLGVDYGFFQNRIFGSLEFYSNTSDNLFFRYYNWSTDNNYTENNGKLKNSGIEASINAIPLLDKAWHWEIGFNTAFNRNKIETLNPGFYESADYSTNLGSPILIQKAGNPINSFNVKTQTYDNQGNPIEGNYTTDSRPYHKAQPDWIMGLSSQLSYKKWDFGFSGRLSLGNYVYNNVAADSYYNMIYKGFYLSNISKSVDKTKFVHRQYQSDYYVENASFFRMDFITLGCSFKNLWNGKADIRLAASIQNAFVITNYSGIDPEVASGIDQYGYPRPRIFSFEININLH